MQQAARHCKTLQHAAHTTTYCNTHDLENACWRGSVWLGNALQYNAKFCSTYFSTLQHTATHCSTLQQTATHCSTLQHIAAHCQTLQNTAKHCNALQDTFQYLKARRKLDMHYPHFSTFWLVPMVIRCRRMCVKCLHLDSTICCEKVATIRRLNTLQPWIQSSTPQHIATLWFCISLWWNSND